MALKLDYFYGNESEQFSFYRIPKALFTDKRYKGICVEAKVLYGLMLDRMSLSLRNGWLASDGRVYIYFTIDVSVKVYDGTSTENMKKGATHFPETSYWDGNVAMAAHNRSSYFGKIYKLKNGDKITFTTNIGTRKYEVTSVYKIDDDDTSCLNDSTENRLTCVENQSAYRWCVIAKEIS